MSLEEQRRSRASGRKSTGVHDLQSQMEELEDIQQRHTKGGSVSPRRTTRRSERLRQSRSSCHLENTNENIDPQTKANPVQVKAGVKSLLQQPLQSCLRNQQPQHAATPSKEKQQKSTRSVSPWERMGGESTGRKTLRERAASRHSTNTPEARGRRPTVVPKANPVQYPLVGADDDLFAVAEASEVKPALSTTPVRHPFKKNNAWKTATENQKDTRLVNGFSASYKADAQKSKFHLPGSGGAPVFQSTFDDVVPVHFKPSNDGTGAPSATKVEQQYLLESAIQTAENELKPKVYLGGPIPGAFKAKTLTGVLGRDLDLFLTKNNIRQPSELLAIPKRAKLLLVENFLVAHGY